MQKITGYLPENDGLKQALTGADVVVIPAGIPRKILERKAGPVIDNGIGKPGMTRDDLFKINAGIVRDLVKGIAQYSPKAFVLVISNPVNSTVPIAAEILKQADVFDAQRLFGVTTLDVVRAETFVQEFTGEKDPANTIIPVIGGHSGETIVPLFSLAKPKVDIPAAKLSPLVKSWFFAKAQYRLISKAHYLNRSPIWRRRGCASKERGGLGYLVNGLCRISVVFLPLSYLTVRLGLNFSKGLRRSSSKPAKARKELLSQLLCIFQEFRAAKRLLKQLVLTISRYQLNLGYIRQFQRSRLHITNRKIAFWRGEGH